MLSSFATALAPHIDFPDTRAAILMLYRWIHLLAGVTWIGLLYFFNLVNVPLMKQLDATTKGKVVPPLMSRALWWFRMSAVITVLSGLLYFAYIVGDMDHHLGNPLRVSHARQGRAQQRPGAGGAGRNRGDRCGVAFP
jgi:hypothetical protein